MMTNGRAEVVLKPPVPVSTQFLPASEARAMPAATAQAASAYKAAKGAFALD
ncbi:hypothetical protein [Tropicibacter oceani]|uniref:Uncharacterized protein n=1 Tax=Tropicibacter oceani TaxID=3058420 RepID=A0ABY8QEF3_9RHOB|nr:hypothetical protein [Tropicibacter oceani]WGW03014.1 hypothetical protein QF118_13880 [Tropicibacter oceani]